MSWNNFKVFSKVAAAYIEEQQLQRTAAKQRFLESCKQQLRPVYSQPHNTSRWSFMLNFGIRILRVLRFFFSVLKHSGKKSLHNIDRQKAKIHYHHLAIVNRLPVTLIRTVEVFILILTAQGKTDWQSKSSWSLFKRSVKSASDALSTKTIAKGDAFNFSKELLDTWYLLDTWIKVRFCFDGFVPTSIALSSDVSASIPGLDTCPEGQNLIFFQKNLWSLWSHH